MERGGPRRGRTAKNASLLHSGELSHDNSKLIGVHAVGFNNNVGSRVCEDMVAKLVARRRSVKPSEEWTSRNSERRSEMHFRVERRLARREENVGGEEVSVTEGDDLLKTFWLATSSRRL